MQGAAHFVVRQVRWEGDAAGNDFEVLQFLMM